MLNKLAFLAPLLLVVVNGQCTAGRTDHFRCAIWVAEKIGFCNTTFYSDTQKQFYCGTACNLCPTTTCGAVYRGTEVIIAPASGTIAAPVAATPIPAGNPLTRVFMNAGCTMNLYTDTPAAGAPGALVAGSPFTGTGTFTTLPPATTAASLRCTCP